MVRYVGNWLNCQAQKVMISGTKSSRRPVTSYVLQESLMGPARFNLLISDPHDGKRVHPQHLCRRHRMGRNCQHIKGVCSHSGVLNRLEKRTTSSSMEGNNALFPQAPTATKTLAPAPNTMAFEMFDSCYFFLKDLGKQLFKEQLATQDPAFLGIHYNTE